MLPNRGLTLRAQDSGTMGGAIRDSIYGFRAKNNKRVMRRFTGQFLNFGVDARRTERNAVLNSLNRRKIMGVTRDRKGKGARSFSLQDMTLSYHPPELNWVAVHFEFHTLVTTPLGRSSAVPGGVVTTVTSVTSPNPHQPHSGFGTAIWTGRCPFFPGTCLLFYTTARSLSPWAHAMSASHELQKLEAEMHVEADVMDDLRRALGKPDDEIEFGGITDRKKIKNMYDRAQSKKKRDLTRKYVLEELGADEADHQRHQRKKPKVAGTFPHSLLESLGPFLPCLTQSHGYSSRGESSWSFGFGPRPGLRNARFSNAEPLLNLEGFLLN